MSDVIIHPEINDVIIRLDPTPVVIEAVEERGPLGPQGPPGPPGPQGPPGDGLATTYTHTQGLAATVWTINHNLGFRPQVSTFSSGDEIEGDIDHVDVNTLTVTFAYAVSGIAFLS